MATYQLDYTIRNNGTTPSVNVQAVITIGDTPVANTGGGYLITNISGTRTINGSTVESITGPNTDSTTNDGADNLFYPNNNSYGANGSGYLTLNGIDYSINPADQSADGGTSGFVNFYEQNTGAGNHFYGEDNSGEDRINEPTPAMGSSFSVTPLSVCYASGTLIRTARGDVPVEVLAVGDLVVTASGAHRPIKWLGHRTLDCRNPCHPAETLPVRIAAHAIADNQPARDLFVSPGHAICLDFLGELLIPAGKLVNGATITRHPVETVTYWHVELDSHDILLAENLPAESFLDCGNRAGLIEQEGEFDRTKGPHTPADFCLPFLDKGVVVEAARARLADRAEAQGWRSTSDMDLHLLVDGARIEPDIFDGVARFLFAAAAREVALASKSVAPSDLSDSLDHRRIGLSVNRVEIEDGLSVRRTWAAGDAALADLFHSEEAAGEAMHRFTDGRAVLPPALWDGCRGFVILRVGFDPAGTRHWLPPGRAEACNVVALHVA